MRNKHRNWETLVQILGLRTQLLDIKQLKTETKDLSMFEFGENYQGKQRVWTFEFAVEFENLYLYGTDPYGVLKNDFAKSPIITNLDETAKPTMPLFYVDGPDKNIYFMAVGNK